MYIQILARSTWGLRNQINRISANGTLAHPRRRGCGAGVCPWLAARSCKFRKVPES